MNVKMLKDACKKKMSVSSNISIIFLSDFLFPELHYDKKLYF